MKKFLVFIILVVLAVCVFAGDEEDLIDKTKSALPPVSGEITVEASSTIDI